MAKIKPSGLKISIQSVERLKNLKDTEYWPAIIEFIIAYQKLNQELVWKLNATSEKMPILHARYVSSTEGLLAFKNFVEKGKYRESQGEND